MIDISNVSVSYETDHGTVSVLENISARIPTGTICAVIGPSGSGKSTFLRCIAGLQKKGYAGMLHVNGVPVDPHKITIGFLPQKYGLLPWKTVRENIELACKLKNIPLTSLRQVETDLIRQLGLENLLDRYPTQISGGEQQRVGLGRIFLLRPDILLMDEPFSALDVITRESIQQIFLALWKAVSVTTVFVTHFIEEAVFLGEQILVFSSSPGKIISIIQNPFFGCRSKSSSQEYVELIDELRYLLGKEVHE